MNYPKPAQEHYLIGLTGNIGSGKSMVRQLLEHLGALGIDADWLARQASLRGSPAYPAIVRRFGQEILGEDGEINRKKLAGIVFADAQALKELEAIIYPPVFSAIDTLIERSPLPVVVIEAIKLLEGDLAKRCRSIWVVEADEQVVFERLQSYRGMERAEVEQRLANQSDTVQKISQADVVIHNSGSLGETWRQILSASNTLTDAPLLPPDFVELGSRLGLLTPCAKDADRLRQFLNAHADSLPAAFLRDKLGLEADQKAQFENEEALLQSLAHYYTTMPDSRNLAIWDINHYACHIGGYCSEDGRQEEILRAIETFSRYHLCDRFQLQASNADETLPESLGYKKCELSISPEGTKARYNLFTKSYPEILNLFQDGNGQANG